MSPAAFLLATIGMEPDPHAPSAFAGVPNVAIVWYDVKGADAASILASLDARRPTDPGDGMRVDALSRWAIDRRWRGSPADRGGLSNATIRVRDAALDRATDHGRAQGARFE